MDNWFKENIEKFIDLVIGENKEKLEEHKELLETQKNDIKKEIKNILQDKSLEKIRPP